MIPQNSTQLSLPLDMNLIEQHRTLKECIAARVYATRGGIAAVAAKLDMSPSHLSEVLGGGGDRHRKLDVETLVRFMELTGDLTPLHWLNARFLAPADANRAHAIEQLAELARTLPGLFAQAGVGVGRARR